MLDSDFFSTKRPFRLSDLVLIPFRCAPVPTILTGVQNLAAGIVPTLQVIVTARFIDAAISVVNASSSVVDALPSLLWVTGLIAFSWLTGDLAKLAQARIEIRIRSKFRSAVVRKRGRLEYRHIEDHEAWDLISRVSDNPETKLKQAYTDLLSIVSKVFRVVGLLALLFAQAWWAALVILAFSVPLFFLAVKSGRANYEASREVTQHERKYKYLGEVLTGREAVAERSLFGFGRKINERWKHQYEASRKVLVKTRTKWFIKMKAGSMITATISILTTLVLLKPVLSGAITLGMYIALVNAIFGLVQMMSWDLTYSVDQLAKNQEYLKDLTQFAELTEVENGDATPSRPAPSFEALEFRDVRFKYPGTDNYVLDGVSFTLNAGSHHAFVGENGAGKTTIIKLVTGLYADYEGSILLNGRSLREYGQRELISMFSVAYQDFSRYYITLGDNIAIGDINRMDDCDADHRIAQAVDDARLFDLIQKLPEGVLTPLGKIHENGLDVSGGEWQRIAMARALVNPAPFRILDEPTAALDPLSESMVYEKFEELTEGKTTLFISHRLGSTKLADEIYVLDGGSIAEMGTHAQLMARQGLYRRMFESQRSWYE
jgi:ATP-binding cassette, subfamily B, bacterial